MTFLVERGFLLKSYARLHAMVRKSGEGVGPDPINAGMRLRNFSK